MSGGNVAQKRAKQDLTPKDIVLAAYASANRGQYAKADALLAPSFFRKVDSVHAELRASVDDMQRLLKGGQRRRDSKAVSRRKTTRALLNAAKALLRIDAASARRRRALWNWVTRNRSLVGIEATR